MILGIDATNLSRGGGLTHLKKVLAAADPVEFGFDKVVVWAPRSTLKELQCRGWLKKVHYPILEANFVRRALWQTFCLGRLAAAEGCHVLFAPGGSIGTKFRPVVTMSRNMLPFERKEMFRYGISNATIRFLMLRWVQMRSLRSADGVIFLTRYAEYRVEATIGSLSDRKKVIPHGISKSLFLSPRKQMPIDAYSFDSPFRLLYVSIVDVYKHQWQVVEAVARLREEGVPVTLTLVGPAYGPSLKKLSRAINKFDSDGKFVQYVGAVRHDELAAWYFKMDGFVFASSCENMPNILLEAMASGLPIACSDRGPMPEILGEGGIYFDPEGIESVTDALRTLCNSVSERTRASERAFDEAKQYSWRRCAEETFGFLSGIAKVREVSSGD